MAYEPPPQPYQPPTYVAPPAKLPSPRRVFWTRGPGVAVVIVVAGLLLFGIYAATGGLKPAGAAFDVAVTSCEGTPGDLPSATVGFTVTNTGKTTRSAMVKIEYRDSAGNRIDTDTSYVRDVEPGDTVRSQESTLLDAAPDGSMTCAIVGVS